MSAADHFEEQTFRQRVCDAAGEAYVDQDCLPDYGEVADLILAMPEMQAIKTALLRLAYAPLGTAFTNMPEMDPRREQLRRAGCPPSVMDWVLS